MLVKRDLLEPWRLYSLWMRSPCCVRSAPAEFFLESLLYEFLIMLCYVNWNTLISSVTELMTGAPLRFHVNPAAAAFRRLHFSSTLLPTVTVVVKTTEASSENNKYISDNRELSYFHFLCESMPSSEPPFSQNILQQFAYCCYYHCTHTKWINLIHVQLKLIS